MSVIHFLDRLRKERSRRSLHEKEVDPNPFVQFKRWFDDALKAKVPEPTAMILATATRKGKPSARVVLMKGVDEGGILFFTNYRSRKGNELAENPNAALLFFWVELDRQIRMEGSVKKTSEEESSEYFASRPRDSRLGAWASEQSRVIANRKELESRFQEFTAKFRNNDIPKPAQWGGFRLEVTRFEFWQGRVNRLHDRIAYEKKNKGWKIVRLSP